MSFNPSEARVPKGSPGGGRWGGGSPRDAKAAEAQKSTGARKHYTAMLALAPKDRGPYVKDLSDADLEALTAILYSSRTSDPDIVNARITVANEMTKRGLDIKKYGALGGGLQAVKKANARQAAIHHARAQHKASAASAAPAKPAPSALRAAPSITARGGVGRKQAN